MKFRAACLVALLVALLTLESPGGAPDPPLPPAFDAVAARGLAAELNGVAPTRVPGTDGDRRAADWVASRLQQVPGGAGDPDALLDAMAQDKKVRDGQLTFILAHGIGQSFIAPGIAAALTIALLMSLLMGGIGKARSAARTCQARVSSDQVRGCDALSCQDQADW